MDSSTTNMIAINLLLLVFAGMTSYLIVYPQYLAWKWGQKSKHWPTVHGEIISSELKLHKSARGQISYLPKAEYEYKVQGVIYRGQRIQFGLQIGYGKNDGQSVVDYYRVGKTVKIYYNPEEPELSILETGIDGCRWVAGWAVIAFLCLFFSVFLFIDILWLKDMFFPNTR